MQETPTPPICEVVILTALGLEYKAVSEHLQDVKEITYQGTIYGYGTFTGYYRTWHVAVAEIGMGGSTAATETERALNYFRPQITLFIGIGGGLKDVKLGHVVAASKVYAYESGKVGQQFQSRPEAWRASHDLEQRARAEARNDEWLARLGDFCPDSVPEVHIGALAAGEKVLASTQSDLFRLLKATYGDTLAVEMEGHGFLAAVHANHSVHGLVVRGISDLIDGKSDADATGSQLVAARHAAAFAFQVLAKFTLPTDNTSIPPTAQVVWNVPYTRNPFFTGRDEILSSISTQFQKGQAVALSGLGGIGKTQIILEYAYRQRRDYEAIFWVHADTFDNLTSVYSEIGRQLRLSPQQPDNVVKQVKQWLENHTRWLLVLDNADDLTLIPQFLLVLGAGHLLLTTRAHSTKGLAYRIGVDTMSQDVGAQFLLRRAGLIEQDALLEAASPNEVALAKEITEVLDGLPLALDQAGTYIDEVQCGLLEYLNLLHKRETELLSRRGGLRDDHPDPIATTWSLSFQRIEQQNPAAAELLRFCAYLAPDVIPEEILTKGASHLGEILAPVAGDPFLLNHALEIIHTYSLMRRDPRTHILTMHRLVQTVLREATLSTQTQVWVQRVILTITAAFPPTFHDEGWASLFPWIEPTVTTVGTESWNRYTFYELCLTHALHCVSWINQKASPSLDDLRLLDVITAYLYTRQRFKEALLLCRLALTICERHFGPTDPQTIIRLNRLAGTCMNMVWSEESLREAGLLYLRTLTFIEQHWNPTDSVILFSLHHLAHFSSLVLSGGSLWKGEIASSAMALQNGVIALTKSGYKQLRNSTDLTAAASLTSLANVFLQLKNPYYAEPFGRRSLAIYEQQPDKADPIEVANCFRCLAFIYTSQWEFREAEAFHQRASSIYEKYLGPAHHITIRATQDLMDVFIQQGKTVEVEALWQYISSLLKKLPEPRHPDLTSVALYCVGRIAEMHESPVNHEVQVFIIEQLKETYNHAREQVLKELG